MSNVGSKLKSGYGDLEKYLHRVTVVQAFEQLSHDQLAPEHVEVIVEFLCEAARDPVFARGLTERETVADQPPDDGADRRIEHVLDLCATRGMLPARATIRSKRRCAPGCSWCS